MSPFRKHCLATSLTSHADDQPQVGELSASNKAQRTESGPMIAGGDRPDQVQGVRIVLLLTFVQERCLREPCAASMEGSAPQ